MPTFPPGSFDRRRRTVVPMDTQRTKPRKKARKTLNKPLKRTTIPYCRLILVWGVLFVSSLILAGNLYHLQVVHSSDLLRRARQQQTTYVNPYIPRRQVVDRNENVLAIDRQVYTLYVHPNQFKSDSEAETVATNVAKVLARPTADLTDLFIDGFKNKKSGIRLAPALSEEIADKLKKLQANGLDLVREYSRLYPQENVVADVVGYVNIDRRGQAGIEYSQEKLLERSAQTVKFRKTGNGALLSDLIPEGFVHRDDWKLQLTLDTRLQRAARVALREQMQKFSAKRGGVIVMDVQDGSILSLVSEPSYNPNEYFNSDVNFFRNWLLADLYEPGSTFKPINIAIALEEQIIQPNDVFPDPDVIKVGGWSIRNAEKENNVALSITGILQHSSNVGMVQVMQRLKPDVYYSWLQKLGIGKTVGIDLPFEARGQLKNKAKFVSSPIEPATASFGQGFSLTPIQLVQLHAALANGGKLVTPHVVRGLIDSQGQLQEQPSLPQLRTVFSPKTTKTLVEMLEAVVLQGSGKASQVPGYRIGGKTGTAQKAYANSRGYRSGAVITSFVGMMPIEAPRYVVLAIVDEPKGIAYGSTVAAPIVKSVMDSLISIERIPPKPTPQVSPSP
ncbi:peptidoglycan D,D-transpeptidase FtsI family protein [Gloeocapsopsis dulcis]|uniref:Cell division protein FtsI n=1 Tax=Gloeocapsopsis dulcis AAB1 = 1H9 TaxID=1433147 RepID=A0A6N8FQK5_9CHRO|nr:penicillin-binding protein 2 [Gloeocapsopsis dulcis]MUL35104.1 cell division protein FtsI [Gloeocapsopsis dulcis AAB1 = 1H9]WNN88987.1 penicillin-binding protein 2 [Gloeocapsopsis dulcis]